LGVGSYAVPPLLTALAFVIAMVASLALGALVRRFAPTIGAVVPPRPDRWHRAPTPTMGGMAIASATVIGFLVVAWRPSLLADLLPWTPVLGASLAMFVVGVLDDRLQLSPVAKLVASLAIGAFLVSVLAGTEPDAARRTLHTLIAIVWFAGVCHAFNLLDNMDGLAAGVALIATAFFAWLLADVLGAAMVMLLVSLAGALLGFLYWNRPTARLFMGDSGSLFIGAMLASTSLVPVFDSGVSLSSPMVPIALILIVPLFDTAFVLVLRRLAGRSATKGGTDHVSHRLVSLGFSERSAVRILYLLGLASGGVAAALVLTGRVEPELPILATFAVVMTLVGIYLARVPAYNAEDFLALQKSSFAPFLKDLAFRWHAGEVMLDLILITVSYYAAYRLRFEGDDFFKFLPYFMASLPIVLGCKLAALYASGLYQRSWDTFGLRDLTVVGRGVGIGSLLSVSAAFYLYREMGASRVVFVIDAILLAIAIIATRVSFRAMNLAAATRNKRSRRVLVYGAGNFGRMLVREMRANTAWNMNPVAFIDDDAAKVHRWIVGVPVRGSIDSLEATMRQYAVDEVILSSSAINGSIETRIREVCASANRPVRRLHMEIR
jgi:UDP-GlcNAc:undecaprenyl-phosphate/decaprenyl-phosphate GlcNAc-1-phosphate transferase